MSLELTSGLLAALLVVAALALPALALGLWPRVRGPRLARQGQRWGLVVASQALAVLAVLVLINDYFGLYSSWDDLLGRTSTDTVAGVIDPSATGARPSHGSSGGTDPSGAPVLAAQVPWSHGLPAGFSAYTEPHSYVALVRAPGTAQALRVYVSLPPQYFQPAYAGKAFPVVELFHGYPGTPTTWYHAMQLLPRYQQAVAAGATPFVLVVAQISVPGAPDLECTDLPGQPQIATFLTDSVPQVVTTHFRVRTDKAGWGLMGYSEGGYCAAQLLLRHPDQYAAAVSISGYDAPESSYFGSAQRAAGDLVRLLAAHPRVALRASASLQDPQAHGSLAALRAAAAPPTVIDVVQYAQGGHNTSDWSNELPADLVWLSRHIAGVTG